MRVDIFQMEHFDGSPCSFTQTSVMDFNNVIAEAFSSVRPPVAAVATCPLVNAVTGHYGSAVLHAASPRNHKRQILSQKQMFRGILQSGT